MDHSHLENVYLKETTLTSTKNKFLLQTSGYSEKYSLPKGIYNLNLGITYPGKRKSTDTNAVTSTENRLLKEYTSLPKKKKIISKIKKVSARRRRRSRSRSREKYFMDDCVVQGAESSGNSYAHDMRSLAAPTSPSYVIGSMPAAPVFGSMPAAPVFGSMPVESSLCSMPHYLSSGGSSFAFGGLLERSPKRRSYVKSGIPGVAFTSPVGFSFDQHIEISEMPVYNFESSEQFQLDTLPLFVEKDSASNLLKLEKIKSLKTKKMQLLNATSMALIFSSNLKQPNDSFRIFIQKCADDVRSVDPEFILKVALYSRQEMNSRSATNFLLSYAAYHEDTRPYLEKYFDLCIRLPSDWIEVADLYQVYHDKRLKNGSLPTALKKVMVKSFGKFDAYQLAKYNRDKTKKQRRKQADLRDTEVDTDIKEERNFRLHGFTLKQLIRLLHLNAPANEIMCLLGKKYPETFEKFKKCGLSGTWDSKRAGQRMKLPQPETWETQVSSKGNKASTWEGLIDNSKLPYMAMLRNLRNLIISDISPKHHEKILQHLENKHAVVNSKQLPLQFYEAFKTVKGLEKLLDQNDKEETKEILPTWKKKLLMKTSEKIKNVSPTLLNRYGNAVSNALEISSLHNLPLIPGRTLVICDVLYCDVSKRKIINNKAFNICIMMGLMCMKACEDCDMKIVYGTHSESVVLDESYSFLKNMMDTSLKHEEACQTMSSKYEGSSISVLEKILEYHLKQQTILKEKLDQVIYMNISGELFGVVSNYLVKKLFSSFLHKYRQIVNPKLLFTFVDLARSSNSFDDTDLDNGKDVYLCGNNTQLLKFIAERSVGDQVTYLDNIDSKYNLLSDTNSNRFSKSHVEISGNVESSVCSKMPKWHTVQIFISSTFKDMHCERDILVRYVFPELRKRAASVFVKINEVDLRWGITETDCATKRASELCLLEAQKSDLFVGILGERYGTTYNFDPPDSPDLQWVKDYPNGLSITELEMYAGALRENKLSEKRSFFYFRNNTFLDFMSPKWKNYFSSEGEESKQKVENLKSKIRSSGVKVLDGYDCKYAGVLSGKPILTGLDTFGKAVLEDLWNAVCKMHENDPYIDDVTEEEMYQQHLLDSFDYYIERQNSSLDLLIKDIKQDCGIFLITGAPGSGKTTFVVNMLKKFRNFSIIKFFIGLTPRSTDLGYMLQYITNSIAKNYPVSTMFPKLTKDVMNNFPDILHEAVISGNDDIILLIDGLEHLEIEDQMMDWLPHTLPPGLRMICTTSDSSYAYKVLCERQMHGTPIHLSNLINLIQSDRECIVRHYLKLYGKVLDESPFNNQMLLLVTKKDSGNPLYLRMSCDFLRSYASFENFMSTLQSLPSTLPLLLQEIILQMENGYSSILVQTALTLLCITKEGLDDADLHLLLSLAALEEGKNMYRNFKETQMKIREMGPDDMLSQVTYCSLLHAICTFAFGHNRFKRFNVSGSELEKAVKKFYLNKNYSNFAKHLHACLAAYYYTLCDPTNNGLWNGHSALAFRGLIYHLFHGQCYQDLAKLFSCLKFLQAIFSVEAADSLLEYYSLLLDKSKTNREAMKNIDFATVLSFNDFITRNLHIFQSYPYLVSQQALNEPKESLVKLKLESSKSCMVERLSPHAYDSRVATFGGFVKNITAAACEYERPVALLGSEDGYLKVLDFSSKRVVRNVKVHTSAITFICIAGDSKICTASTDTTISVWSIADYNRIYVLKGHKHCVSCCCTDYSNNILLSSGWDNSVRFWSLRDGRSISVIDNFRCPVNCLDHHPTKQQVACGLWSGHIEIWDTLSLKKLLVFESNYTSVKSLAYTPDGINIISSYMNSDVLVWSSEQGLKISSLKGHILPVKSISYSYLGDMIISGSDDCTLKVWPTESGLSVCNISACKFCPIGLLEIISPNCIAVGFQNSEIWVMDIHNGNVLSKMTLKSDKVSCFSRLSSVNSNSAEYWVDTALVLGTQLGEIMVGDIITGTLKVVESSSAFNARITSITHNKTLIICANSNGDIGIFSYPGNDNACKICKAHDGSVSSLSLTIHNGDLCVLSAAADKIVKLWIIDEEELSIESKDQYISKHKDMITCCCVFPQFNDTNVKFLTGSHDNNVILHSDHSETEFQGLKTSVVSVDFNDTCIIGCGSDGSIAIWSYDGKLLSAISGLEQSSAILSFRIDRDSADEFDITLVFADLDGSIKVRKPIQRSFFYSLEGHSKSVTSCCACASGEILSSSLDGTVNLWKMPIDTQNIHLHHTAAVTDIIISVADGISISSDAHGNIVLWELNTSSDFPLTYASKKSYIGGYIKALSWLQNSKFVCAVSQIIDNKEKYFLDIICYASNSMDESDAYNLQVIGSHYFESEVLCLDTRYESDSIVAGFKSGDFVIIAGNVKKVISTSEDWILGAKIIQSQDSIEFLFLSLLNGTVKRYETAKVMDASNFVDVPFRKFFPSNLSPYNSAFCCENENRVFCGDTQGNLRAYTKENSSYFKKVHDDLLTGISVTGPYVFTCSRDRTVKGWNTSTLEQVCQFHSTVPITSVKAHEDITDGSTSYLLVIGTTSGAVYLLKFYPG